MSEVNPPPVVAPPVEQPAPVTPPPPPAQAPAPPPPAATPDLGGVLTRLEQVITGLPERTANAVREVSPQHVANPTQPGQQQQPPPNAGPVEQKTNGGPGRFAKWFFGQKD